MLEEAYDLAIDLDEYFEYIYSALGKDKNQEFNFLEGLEEEEIEQRPESALTF